MEDYNLKKPFKYEYCFFSDIILANVGTVIYYKCYNKYRCLICNIHLTHI